MTGTDVLNTQLDTGQMEMTTIADAVRDSGAIDVTLEEDEEGDNNQTKVQENNGVGDQHSKKCHQGTQTDVSMMFSNAHVVVYEKGRGRTCNNLQVQCINRYRKEILVEIEIGRNSP